MPQIQKAISEFLTGRSALTVPAEAMVMDAVKAMTSERREYVLVVEEGAIVGIFTERDFLNRVVAVQLSPGETPIRDVMTSNPDQLRPIDNICYVIEKMASCGYRNVPIVNEDGAIAVLTVWDVMSHLSEVLAEVDEVEDEEELEEWTDMGGG